jgi:hypothetical protein
LVFSFGGFTLCEAQAPWGNIPVKRRARSRARERQLFWGIRWCAVFGQSIRNYWDAQLIYITDSRSFSHDA